MSKPKAVIYARVSTKEQDTNHSIPSQIEYARQYAQQRGMEVIGAYREDASGFKYPRPELEKALEALEAGEAGAIIVHTGDRLNRHEAFGYFIRSRIRDAGAELHYSLSGQRDLEGATTIDMVHDAFAAYEARTIIERMTRGKRFKAKSGKWPGVGSPPYGYRVAGQGKDTRLEVNEEEAQWVRKIYEWYAIEGISVPKIAERLAAYGVRRAGMTRQKSSDSHALAWSDASIYNILRRETYAGRFYANRRIDTKLPNGKRLHSERPRSEWIEVQVPAIIDERLFSKAQSRMKKGKTESFRNRKYEYLMSTRLTCGVCGRSMSTMPAERGKYMYYRCTAFKQDQPGRERCKQPLFSVTAVDATIWEFFKRLLKEPDYLRLSVREAQEHLKRNNRHYYESAIALDEAIERHDELLREAVDLYLSSGDSPFTRELAKGKQQEYEAALQRLHKERTEVGRWIAQSELSNDSLNTIENYVADIRDELDILEPPDQREVIRAFDGTARLAVEDGRKVIYFTIMLQTHRILMSGASGNGTADDEASTTSEAQADSLDTDSSSSLIRRVSIKHFPAASPTAIPLTFRLVLAA